MLLIQLQSEMCWEIISWKLGLKQKSKSNNRIWKTELFLRFNKFNIHSPKWFNWANTHLRFHSTINESVGADTRFCQRAEKWQEFLSMNGCVITNKQNELWWMEFDLNAVYTVNVSVMRMHRERCKFYLWADIDLSKLLSETGVCRSNIAQLIASVFVSSSI